MSRFLVIDNSATDTAFLSDLIINETGARVEVCLNSALGCAQADAGDADFAALFLLWDETDTYRSDLVARFRTRWPTACIFAIFGELTWDAGVEAIARGMGVKEIVMKPLKADTIKDCLQQMPATAAAPSPRVARINLHVRGNSPALMLALAELERVLDSDEPVLLLGESGTGKGVFARAIHACGPRGHLRLVGEQVSSHPEHLIESLLFGHERGAFTDAKSQRIGILEEAGTGTLFLDEIGTLPIAIQIKLLSVLQERHFRRIGGTQQIEFRARLICATNAELDVLVKTGAFREDLYYRINVLPLRVPALRERKADILPLAEYFLTRDGSQRRLSAEAALKLSGHDYEENNVRELENLIKRAIVLMKSEAIVRPRHLLFTGSGPLPAAPTVAPAPPTTTPVAPPPPASHLPPELFAHLTALLPLNWLELGHKEVEKLCKRAVDRVYLKAAYERKRGKVAPAARALQMDPKTFRERWEQADLRPPLGNEEEPAANDAAPTAPAS